MVVCVISCLFVVVDIYLLQYEKSEHRVFESNYAHPISCCNSDSIDCSIILSAEIKYHLGFELTLLSGE